MLLYDGDPLLCWLMADEWWLPQLWQLPGLPCVKEFQRGSRELDDRFWRMVL